jgi:hypothetical protein
MNHDLSKLAGYVATLEDLRRADFHLGLAILARSEEEGNFVPTLVDDAEVSPTGSTMGEEIPRKAKTHRVTHVSRDSDDRTGIAPAAPGGRKIGGESGSGESCEQDKERKGSALHEGKRSRATLRW